MLGALSPAYYFSFLLLSFSTTFLPFFSARFSCSAHRPTMHTQGLQSWGQRHVRVWRDEKPGSGCKGQPHWFARLGGRRLQNPPTYTVLAAGRPAQIRPAGLALAGGRRTGRRNATSGRAHTTFAFCILLAFLMR
jgi:hypothetical protein